MAEQLLGGRYRLLQPLGTGGMATVYLAEDMRLGRRVAVKILHPQFAADPAFVVRFEAEARMAAALSHPNIVQVFDVGHDGNRYYIVMEYVDGETLKEAIARQGPLPGPRALTVIGGVLAALEFAHAHHLIHRDIKAQNILLTRGNDVKVTDFGIAREVGGAAAPTLTATGMVIGSVHYFAPEQAQGRPATAQSDVYAAGIVLYEMLTGRLPFEGDNPFAVAMQQINQAPALPTRLNATIPPPIEAIVLKAMAKNPTERYGGAGTMKRAVDALLTRAGEPTRLGPRVATSVAPTVPVAVSPGATRTTVRAPAARARAGPAGPAAPVASRTRYLWRAIIALGLILLALAGYVVASGGFPGVGGGNGATATAIATVTPVASPTTPPATATAPAVVPPQARPTDTDTPLPAATDTPTPQPTATPVPAPTNTPVPAPTNTPVPAPTNTPVPPPTSTPVPPPTNTPVPVPVPTPSDTPVPAPTDTPVPVPTATPSAAPTTTGPGNAAALPAIALSPTTVSAGDLVTVDGSGWTDGATVTLSAAFGGDANDDQSLGNATVSGGQFSISFTVPDNAVPATYQVNARDDQSESAHRLLTVQ